MSNTITADFDGEFARVNRLFRKKYPAPTYTCQKCRQKIEVGQWYRTVKKLRHYHAECWLQLSPMQPPQQPQPQAPTQKPPTSNFTPTAEEVKIFKLSRVAADAYYLCRRCGGVIEKGDWYHATKHYYHGECWVNLFVGGDEG
ncbi:MAG: hypothetical protein ACQXXJ_02200 [Candidatus Bathyarchaeia archaeon]